MSKPFYRTHALFPDLGGKSMMGVGWKLGLARGLGVAYHNTAVQVLPNGDLVGFGGKNSELWNFARVTRVFSSECRVVL